MARPYYEIQYMATEYTEYLAIAREMAREAGKIQLRYFRSAHLEMQTKLNVKDVVTAADKACETHLKSMIHSRFPTHGIIAEESGEENADNEWRWVIDPLDGTTNFSQGYPMFCCSIALEHNGEPVVGVVYAPYLDELFEAVKGKGAKLNGKPIHCSTKGDLATAVLATDMPYDRNDNPDNNLTETARMIPLARAVRLDGSAAMDLCYMAAGFYDAYWELNLKHWDVAAGRLIACEAGAVVKDIRHNRNYSVLASGPRLLATVEQLLLN